MGRVGGRVVAAFLGLMVVSAALTALAAPPLIGRLRLDAGAVAAPRGKVGGPPAVAGASLREWATGLTPANPFRAAADGAMLPLVVFTAVCAVAATRLPAARAEVPGRRGPDADRDRVGTGVGADRRLRARADAGREVRARDRGAIGYYVLVVCGLVMAAAYSIFGLPPEGVALLIALDAIPDMFGSGSNVSAGLVPACIIARRAGYTVTSPSPLPAHGSFASRQSISSM